MNRINIRRFFVQFDFMTIGALKAFPILFYGKRHLFKSKGQSNHYAAQL